MGLQTLSWRDDKIKETAHEGITTRDKSFANMPVLPLYHFGYCYVYIAKDFFHSIEIINGWGNKKIFIFRVVHKSMNCNKLVLKLNIFLKQTRTFFLCKPFVYIIGVTS